MDFTLVSLIFDALRISPPLRLTLLDASTLASAHVPPFPPDTAALIVGIDSPESAAHLKEVLLTAYPREHVAFVVDKGKTREERELGELENWTGSWFVPPLGEGTSFESFAEIVAHLRAPNGCPWDREQTHASLRKHLLEESYEAISAIDSNNFADMREEFGDLLLQIVLQAQIANEAGQFNVNEVIRGIHSKIVRRHPHVFGDLKLDGVDAVLENWEKLKEQERGGKKEEKGILDGVPTILPALSQAQEYQDRAARVGFDWNDIGGVLDKIKEEIEEIKTAETDFELASEIGDLFFVLVNLARWKNVDAESALRGTNMKFKKRFAYVEQGAKRQGRNLSELSLDEMEALWQEAKRREG
ncbi:MAG: nucleoside triphosphate pyrophosphohydrolase [Anaerolineae bacterium]|nr:MAG: nucleoside triphosphate pyrophosphohydrolase [Anaerolineae bacterium]WKZ43083.1 MAG: nucleoside triphosphate pyrophosphohydrolase [Anaerolineales bacterium]